MSSDKPSKTEQQLRAVRAGIVELLQAGQTFPLLGKNLDLQAALQAIDAQLGPYEDVHQLRMFLGTAVSTRKSNEANAKVFVKTFKCAALGHYGEQSEEFRKLGFEPQKKAELTVDQKAQKIEKIRQTRAARHTLGPKARKAIRGTVEPPPPPAS